VATQPGKPPRPEISPLTGIRIFAALWVLSYHLYPDILAALPRDGVLRLAKFPLYAFTSQGYLGVDLFFILSGFVLSYNYGDSLSRVDFPAWRKFLWRRFARIWPVHAVMLAAYAVTLAAAGSGFFGAGDPERFSLNALLANLFLVQAWSIPVIPSWNEPAWSVSCEWLAYLLFPLLCLTPLLRSRASSVFLLALLSLLGMTLFCQLAGFAGTASYGLARIAGGFLAGCCVYRLYSLNVGAAWNWRLFTPILLVSILATSVVLLRLRLLAFGVTPLLGLLLLGVAYGRCDFSRLLGHGAVKFLGAASYSVYMVHELCILSLRHTLPLNAFGQKQMPFVVCIWLLTTILAGIVLFLLVERPSRDFLKRFGRQG
jgi:peptidoglycan/LPS O-acetylase OafA/YrhL